MIALMVVPPSVLIVPLFILMVSLKQINTLQGLITIYVGLLIPFSIYLLVSFFRSLPHELFDAASIDGCSNPGVLWRIVLPLSGPAFITLVIVNALYVWNELLLALVFLQDEDLKTLMPGLLMFKGHFFNNEALVMAAAFLACMPMILLYLFGQRWFVEGLTAGSIK
jgi:ABC-type glycerol-3-phosphate transport system permease component